MTRQPQPKDHDGGLVWLFTDWGHPTQNAFPKTLFSKTPTANYAEFKQREKTSSTKQKRRLHNKTIKSSLKTQLRKVHAAVAGDDPDAREGAFQTAVSSLDRAAAKKVIHPTRLLDSNRDFLRRSKLPRQKA